MREEEAGGGGRRRLGEVGGWRQAAYNSEEQVSAVYVNVQRVGGRAGRAVEEACLRRQPRGGATGKVAPLEGRVKGRHVLLRSPVVRQRCTHCAGAAGERRGGYDITQVEVGTGEAQAEGLEGPDHAGQAPRLQQPAQPHETKAGEARLDGGGV